MRGWLLASLLLICLQGKAQTDAQCERAAIHYEARGEGILTQKAVLEVVRRRAKLSGKSVCKVLLEKGQFPWASRRTLKIRLAPKQKTAYDVVRLMENNVLPKDFIYFNYPAHKWGWQRKRIGKLTFNNVRG